MRAPLLALHAKVPRPTSRTTQRGRLREQNVHCKSAGISQRLRRTLFECPGLHAVKRFLRPGTNPQGLSPVKAGTVSKHAAREASRFTRAHCSRLPRLPRPPRNGLHRWELDPFRLLGAEALADQECLSICVSAPKNLRRDGGKTGRARAESDESTKCRDKVRTEQNSAPQLYNTSANSRTYKCPSIWTARHSARLVLSDGLGETKHKCRQGSTPLNLARHHKSLRLRATLPLHGRGHVFPCFCAWPVPLHLSTPAQTPSRRERGVVA